VLLEGTAIVLVVLGVMFWFSLGLDWLYFFVQKEDLPYGVRAAVLIAAACLVACAGAVWLGARLFRTFRQKALAMVLERRFPELDDRLITAIEASEHPHEYSGLSEAMLARTVQEVGETTAHLQIGQVFDRRPLFRASLAALALAVSIVGFAVLFQDVFLTWFNRNLNPTLMASETWHRRTHLRVVVLAEPDERVIEFKNGVVKHPRGSDLTVMAEALPESVVPDQVQFRYRMQSGARGRAYFAQIGQTQFKHTLSGVLEDLDFYLIASDARRETYHVQVVDPPRIDEITLYKLYPAYMHRVEDSRSDGRYMEAVNGTQATLPAGTDFLMRARANKPLTAVRIQTDAFDLNLSPGAAQITLFQQGENTNRGGTFVIPEGAAWLASDGTEFTIPFVLALPGSPDIVDPDGRVHLPLRLPADSLFRMTLTDADDIRSVEPARLTINARADESPIVSTQLRGIGSSITRKARIPVVGTVVDDYGVADARFDYKVDEEEQFHPRPLVHEPGGKTEFALGTVDEKFERFEVLPLELKIGQKLTLGITASDADNLYGPHVTFGERYQFQVVSEEELLSQLYARELNLRHRFEQILEEVKATRDDLSLHRGRLQDAAAIRKLPAKEQELQEIRDKLESVGAGALGSADRALNNVGKNHNENQAIEQSFVEIREEMINNAVETTQSLERMDDRLLKPLRTINQVDFPDVDQTLGLVRLALIDKQDPLPRLDETLVGLERLIDRMETVLSEMRRLETFKELVELLKAIKNQQEDLRRKTKRQAIEGID
jgi:hypothetical protein